MDNAGRPAFWEGWYILTSFGNRNIGTFCEDAMTPNKSREIFSGLLSLNDVAAFSAYIGGTSRNQTVVCRAMKHSDRATFPLDGGI